MLFFLIFKLNLLYDNDIINTLIDEIKRIGINMTVYENEIVEILKDYGPSTEILIRRKLRSRINESSDVEREYYNSIDSLIKNSVVKYHSGKIVLAH